MTQCNCRNTDELRIVRGNAFAIRLTVTAIHIDGTIVENFVLGEAEAVLKVMHNDDKTQKDFLVAGNDAVISFDGTQSLGWYGFEMTGTFNGKPWRWCVPQVFQIVETNAKANIPSWAFLTDDTYTMEGVMTITSGDIYQSDWDETNPQSPSYIKNKPDVVLHPEFNQTVQRIDQDIDAEETRAKGAEKTLQDNIDAEALARSGADTTLQGHIDDEETRAKAAEKQNADDIDALETRMGTAEGDIDTIEGKIPAQASDQNQLADKEFVNSSIATSTATYRGAYNLVSDLSLTTAATEQQIADALATKMAALSIEPDNNDYCFVQIPTADATPTQIARVDRYKYNGTVWSFEFSLNNSGFTAAQWAALNSGITSGLVTKLSDLPTNSELTTLLNGKADKVANATAGNFAGLDSNGNPTDSGKKASDFATAAQGTKADEAASQATTYTKTEVDGLVGDEETRAKAAEKQNADDIDALETRMGTAEGDIDTIEGKIPAQASDQNQLADKEFVNSSIATSTATYRGAYNLVSDLSLTTAATEQQIADALATKMAALSIEPDNNDYCFVQIPTADATPTQIARVDRYKYNGTVWSFEFSLNNSGFTAAQWAALNSGITSGLVTKLSDLPTNTELTTLLNGKANINTTVTNVSFDSTTNKLQQTINGQTSDVCNIVQAGFQIMEDDTTGIDTFTPVGGATITEDNTNGLDVFTL